MRSLGARQLQSASQLKQEVVNLLPQAANQERLAVQQVASLKQPVLQWSGLPRPRPARREVQLNFPAC